LNRYRRAWSSRREVMITVLGAALDVQRDLVAAFAAAGVALMTGTDAPLTFVFPGWSLHHELELFVDCGLSPYEALRAATVTPAKFVGWQDRVGTVAIGREADLVLVDGDPLIDVRNAARVHAVVVRGRLLDRATLDRGLADLAAGYERSQTQLASIGASLDAGDFEAAAAAFAALEAPDPGLASYVENALNDRGYELLSGGQVDDAMALFDLNVESFPRSANAWDSLAEAWMTKGNKERAIEFYRKSLELDPGNANATEMIGKIRAGK
jgi:tetratricopeptide (TPR) repeat protein